jgi:hypothetical protein
LILHLTATATTTTSSATLKAKQNTAMGLSGLGSAPYLSGHAISGPHKGYRFLVNVTSFVYVSDISDMQKGTTIDIMV